MRCWAPTSWLITAASLLGAALPPAPHQVKTSRLQLTSMTLDLRVDYDRAAIGGSATLVLRNVGDRAATTIPLLLNRLMKVSRIDGPARQPIRFSQSVTVVEGDSMRQVTAIVVTPTRPLPPGDSAAITVHYDGRLVGYTETGSLYIRDHVDSAFTIIREDALAFPVLGGRTAAVNGSISRGEFSFAASVTVPVGQVVAMGGDHQRTPTKDSLATWIYRSKGTVPFLNIAVAPFRTLHRPGANIFYFAEDSAGARMVDSAIALAVDRFSQWFGALEGRPALTVIEIPEGWGSQGSLTAGIIQTADAFRDRGQLYQLYHELSHLWNAPDREARSPRWNEGLASFLQWRMAAELDGWNNWDARLERSERSIRANCDGDPLCGKVPFSDYGAQNATGLSYSVGMLFFYALHRTLGEERFFATYRDLFQRHRGGITSSDLIAAFEAADPRAARIIREWFTTTKWFERMAAGESAKAVVDSYAMP